MPIMQMVPLLMKEESNEDYEPKVVSFGPYHHGKEKLKFVEEFKPEAVKLFIGDKNEDDFMAAILLDIGYAKSCYLEEFTKKYTNDEFALMMFRDACVILNYFGSTEVKESSSIRAETINYHLGLAVYKNIRRDMYLLENQVPFRILEILVGIKYGTTREEFRKDMEKRSFRMFFNDGEIEEGAANENNKLGQNALHLLEIFRRVIVTGVDHGRIKTNDSCCNVDDMLSCLESCCCKDDKNESSTRGTYVFRSVTDLKSKGIYSRASESKSVKGIRFSPNKFCRYAELKLPIMYVDMYTKVFFKNMIAYEFSPYAHVTSKSVIGYVSFMKLLVVTKKDVKELRENKIIINSLGSDEDVVQVYKDLNTYEGEDTSDFWNVKVSIENHYNSKFRTWMAEFTTTYFNNPWSIIALVASLVLLCLDIVQTYYAIHPPNNDGGGKVGANQSFSSPGF